MAAAPEAEARPSRWSLDSDGVVRVDLDALTEVASVLTWLQGAGKPIDLSPLKSQSPEQIGRLELAAGRAPLWLRRAPLPLDLPLLTRWGRSCVVRFGAPVEGAFSWAVLKSAGPDRVSLLDPRHGAVVVPSQVFESTLLGAYGLYVDSEDLASLRAGEEGLRVEGLRKRLREAGATPAPAGSAAPAVYDRSLTESVAGFQQQQGLPASGAMDALTAWLLVTAPSGGGAD